MEKGCLEALKGIIIGRRRVNPSDIGPMPGEGRPGEIGPDGRMWVPGLGWTTQEQRDQAQLEIQRRGKPPERKITNKGSLWRDE